MAPPPTAAASSNSSDKKKTALIAVACATALVGLGIWARRQQRQRLQLQRKQLTSLRFDLSVEGIEGETELILARMKHVDDEVAAVPLASVSFVNTAQKLIDLDVEMLSRATNVTFRGQVSASKAVRDACTKADEAIDDFSVQRGMRADVYKVIKHLYTSAEFKVRTATGTSSLNNRDSLLALCQLETGRSAPALRQEARARFRAEWPPAA